MNKNLWKVLLCILLLIALDRLVGAGLRYLYFKPDTGKYHDLTYAIDSTRAEVVVIGSSRASHSYVSQVLEDSLGLSVYNAGMEGAKFLHQYATFKGITSRYKPKMIIWDYWEGLSYSELNYLELTTVSPYYFTHPAIQKLIDDTRPNEKYKMLCAVYPFNSSLVYNLNKSLSVYKNKEKSTSVKGWIPLERTWNEPLAVADSAGVGLPLDTNCVKLYTSAVKYCRENHIKLYMVQSPFFIAYRHPTYYDVVAQKIAAENGVPYFNFFNDSTALSSPKYFAEPRHLNDEGAHMFTTKLAIAIKKTEAELRQKH
ncbi:hypothetical protein [Mucilaginibacter psychrotolerans]|uniref:SGNH/GDSL hydrolase family protein n=1 Tax=Mucilaginibacter psychrotolerans TaxID=1524096 RepID=A0A4Y8SJX8_9SPHI|nr:hypothetical protein [Mucilaginibacter psychrotolerans]TFF39192.1 hypothetical protein E2R66_06095 [Mucilaginibacter psychrotolerans]